MPKRNILKHVIKEFKIAYADHFIGGAKGYATRNLSWKSGTPILLSELIEFLESVDFGYNNFDATCLIHLNPDLMVYPAREGSFCIYVLGKIRYSKKLKCDELDKVDVGQTRIWWD